jgi:cob(I)alamin adenosyltransferase
MKIYTGTGDNGKTSLFSGERVSKSSLRIEAYGDLDELNSIIGAVDSLVEKNQKGLKEEIRYIQSSLLDAGAWLATTPDSDSIKLLPAFTERPSKKLEKAIDRMSNVLPPLKQFVLPGGHLSASLAHIARTVCRRAERRAIELVNQVGETIVISDSLPNVLVFLNRLSDYLFVLARYCNHLQGEKDNLWQR